MYDKMFRSDSEKLSKLLDQVEIYELQLPDFQRGWVWEDTRIRRLLASLTKGFPIGAIMLLEAGGDCHFKCKSIEGSGEANREPVYMILDGQQRMTSTYLSMRSKKPVDTMNDQKKPIRRYYYLDIKKALNPEIDRYDAIVVVDENKQIRENIGRDIVLDLSTREKEFENKMIPFNILSNSMELNDWRNGYQAFYEFNSEIIKEYQNIDDTILQQVINYEVPYIKVLKDTPKEAVCQVFENVNQGGKPLTVFELITATFAADNFDLKKHWEDISKIFEKYPTLSNVDNTSFLIAMTLLVSYRKNGTIGCKRKDVLNLKYNEFESNENDLVEGFKRMYDLLVDMKIFSRDDIPYNTQFIPLSVICTILGNDLYNANIKRKIKQWYWCGVLGELYGGANESRYALDVPQVIEWIRNDNAETPKTINDCNFNTMRLLGLRTKNSAAYKGIMALILGNNAKDWINGTEMSVTNYIEERSDIHHIFPQAYCEESGYDKRKWNSIINKTPIFFSTNRYIGGVAPSKYIEKIIEKREISNEELKEYIESHLIKYNLLNQDRFEEFIINRAKKILNAIEEATGKKITDRNSEEVINYFGESLQREAL